MEGDVTYADLKFPQRSKVKSDGQAQIKKKSATSGQETVTQKYHLWIRIMIIALALLCVILFIMVIIMVVKCSYLSENLRQEEEKNNDLNRQYVVLKNSFCLPSGNESLCETYPSNWTVYRLQTMRASNSSCYFVSENKLEWEASKNHCLSMNADLAVIKTDPEKEFLKILFAENDEFWIGLTDKETEGQWKWVDGTSFNKTDKFWGEKQPDDFTEDKKYPDGEDCASLEMDMKKEKKYFLNDAPCVQQKKYICQKNTEGLF